MQIVHALLLALAVTSCRAAQDEPMAKPPADASPVPAAAAAAESFEAPVPDGLLVRVYDLQRAARVPHAEVRADVAPTAAGPEYPELLFAGTLGRVDRHGRRWRCDENGEVRIARDALRMPIVAHKGDQWGCFARQWQKLPDSGVVDIVLLPDESIRVECADAEGRSGVGSMVWISAVASEADADEPDESCAWGARVERADGSIDVPHAQIWRGLAARGDDVRIAGFTLWDGPRREDPSRPFPAGGPLRFEVAPVGSIDVVLLDEHGAPIEGYGEVELRWLDAPVDPIDPDAPREADVPELPFTTRDGRRTIPGVALDHRFELALEDMPGWIDPRVVFDGPKAYGERVRVDLAMRIRAATIQGRLIDPSGKPLAHHACEMWIEHEGRRIAVEGDGTYTDADGRFACDLAPFDSGPEAVFVVQKSGSTFGPMVDGSWGGNVVLGGEELAPLRRNLTRPLTAGVHDLGDVR